MFSQAETEALVLGMRWVSRRGDSQLASAAGRALAKIADVLPPALREELEANTLLIAPVQAPPVADAMRVLIRDTIRRERKLHIDYLDLAGQRSERLLWPFALGFSSSSRCWSHGASCAGRFAIFASIAFRPLRLWNSAIRAVGGGC